MKNLKNKLKEGLANCYLLEGEDYEILCRAFNMILKRANLTMPDFNLIKFDDENFSMQAVVDACQVLPMCDEYRVVLVKNIAKLSELDKKTFKKYLNNQQSSTILILFDFLNVFSDFKTEVEFVDCKRLDKNLLCSVVVKELEKFNKKISPEAIDKLIEFTNGYLTNIVSEINKLVYYDITEQLITKNVIEKLVSKDDEAIVFELTEALGKKQSDKALQLLENFKKENGILNLISNHFRRLFYIAISDLSDKDLALMLGVKEYAILKQRTQANNFSKMQLKKIFSLLEEVDFGIKSGAMTQETALSYVVLSILYI